MAAWMPNVPETVVVMLATLALGAVFTSSSADFGTAGVVDRFGQVEPKVVLAADGYLYGGKQFDCLARLAEIVAALPTVGTVVVVGHVEQEPDLGALADAVAYDAWLAPHRGAPVPATRFGFDQPGFVLYSSGTTGTPKCIVHRAAGVLLKHRTEHSPALRRPPWRRRLLLHDLWVDDVELADECALGRRHDRALRGQPVPSRPGRAARPRRPSRRHAVRRVGEVHRQPAQGRGAATRHPRPRDGADHLLDRVAAVTRGLRLRLRRAEVRCAPGVDLRRNRSVRLLRRRRPHPTGLARRDPGARPRDGGGRVRRRRNAAPGRPWRARLHPPVPLDATRVLGGQPTAVATAPPTSSASPGCGRTGTSPRGRPTAAS